MDVSTSARLAVRSHGFGFCFRFRFAFVVPIFLGVYHCDTFLPLTFQVARSFVTPSPVL